MKLIGPQVMLFAIVLLVKADDIARLANISIRDWADANMTDRTSRNQADHNIARLASISITDGADANMTDRTSRNQADHNIARLANISITDWADANMTGRNQADHNISRLANISITDWAGRDHADNHIANVTDMTGEARAAVNRARLANITITDWTDANVTSSMDVDITDWTDTTVTASMDVDITDWTANNTTAGMGEPQVDDIITRMANISITERMDRPGVFTVVQSFANTCPGFFLKDKQKGTITPTILSDPKKQQRYKQICQRYLNKYRYATLYDTTNKIPVYSAYEFNGYKKTDRLTDWMIEPQLDSSGAKADMTTESMSGVPSNQLGAHQALNKNYKGSGYQKGHLYPHCQNCMQDQAESTFTLTNAAPQEGTDNIKWYQQAEKLISNNIDKNCVAHKHVVTGVTPGQKTIDGKVNIPKYYWSAYCCENQNKVLVSEGYLMHMTGNGNGRMEVYEDSTNQKFKQLNAELTKLYGSNFEIFGKQKGCS